MDELKRPQRKGSLEEDEMQDMEHEPMDMSKFKPTQKEDTASELTGLMQKMQIAVVGRETGKDSDEDFEDQDSEEDVSGDDDVASEEGQDQNQQVSGKHTKFTDMEARAREDMDFPDEVDTPFVKAYERF